MIRKSKDRCMATASANGWPKFGRLAGILGLVATMSAGMVGCSSTDEEEYDEEEMVNEEGGSEDPVNANDANAGEEIAEEAGGDGEMAYNDGATDNIGNIGAENFPVEDIPVNDAAGVNPVPVENGTATDAVADVPEATNTTDSVPMPVSSSYGAGLPAGTVGVVYVSGSRAAIFDAPNGREVGRLVNGDFILASAEGDWAKTHDGRYIRSSELQLKPVGRVRVQSRWKRSRN